jgi:DNA-binding NarL/FixJ family response regulator
MSRIAIIDDSRLMQVLLRRILERAGHEVDVWADVTAMGIADLIAAQSPALLITDYSMPGCNGLTVARMARKVQPELPIVVVMATHDPTIMDALNRQEVSCILHKPIQEDELLAAVAQALADEA